jgi:hypothetical protein
MILDNKAISDLYKDFFKNGAWDNQYLDLNDEEDSAHVYFTSEGDFISKYVGEYNGDMKKCFKIDFLEISKLFNLSEGETIGTISKDVKIKFDNKDRDVQFVTTCKRLSTNPVHDDLDYSEWETIKISKESIKMASNYCGVAWPYNFIYYDMETSTAFASNEAAAYRETDFKTPSFAINKNIVFLINLLGDEAQVSPDKSKIYFSNDNFTCVFSVHGIEESILEYVELTMPETEDVEFEITDIESFNLSLEPHNTYNPDSITMFGCEDTITIMAENEDKSSAIRSQFDANIKADEANYSFRWNEFNKLSFEKGTKFMKHPEYDAISVIKNDKFCYASL